LGVPIQEYPLDLVIELASEGKQPGAFLWLELDVGGFEAISQDFDCSGMKSCFASR